MEYAFRFPVVRGFQAKQEYYIAMVPIKMLSRLFVSDDEYVLPEYRAQRKLNETRIPVISRYILENRDSYVFSALAASIDGEYRFFASDISNDLGVLEVSLDARFLINDGQHRKSAILEAIREDPSLGNETIPLVFFVDQGLARSQQIFTDLNKNAVRTSNSISELYDSRDQMAVITREVIHSIPFLNAYTDKEKDILGKYSSSLFTLNTFYIANKNILSNKCSADGVAFLKKFWLAVVQHMPQWQELEHKELTKVDLREQYIATQSIVIQALGRVGSYIYRHEEIDLQATMKLLENVNWNRTASCWLNRAIAPNGRVITSKKASMLIANIIKTELHIPLDTNEVDAENGLLSLQSEQEGNL